MDDGKVDTAHSRTSQLPSSFSKASHLAKMFFFLTASQLKVKELQLSPSKLVVVRAEADGGLASHYPFPEPHSPFSTPTALLFLIRTQKGLAVIQRKRKVKAETDSKADESETKTSNKTTEPEIK